MDHESAVRRIENWRLKNSKIVFTNGCFDILHKGHVSYLAEAASLGNKLVVALNSDASVKRQGKGDDRPINNEDARSIVMSALGFVDMVVFFDKDTPIELIELLRPDILVKGADYDPEETDKNAKSYIVGSDVILNNGGKVKAITLIEGYSTTSIINKLKA
ncbi:MAG: D-glycero-beta-D-manno-heptose 1-phosphate adenylyltransferase [Crocinitomicaceae bacterium]|nr:D-glycero-beta-D-manno-heptose 1-phosphate adenylyltransferase [Crocinitomicaceae bacterium]